MAARFLVAVAFTSVFSLLLVAAGCVSVPQSPSLPTIGVSKSFQSSDGVRLNYREAGQGRTLIFIPGWTMPAVIFAPQLVEFQYIARVIAFDPRSQGESQTTLSGHTAERRGRDIAELLDALAAADQGQGFAAAPPILIGWSLGVLEILAYLSAHGDTRIAGLVLIDNSIGEAPAPKPSTALPDGTKVGAFSLADALRVDRDKTVREFVQAMYRRSQPAAYLEAIALAALATPLDASLQLLNFGWPRERWRAAVYATAKPILYVTTPMWAAQGVNLARQHPAATVVNFSDAGHALFVDESARFNELLKQFINSISSTSH